MILQKKELNVEYFVNNLEIRLLRAWGALIVFPNGFIFHSMSRVLTISRLFKHRATQHQSTKKPSYILFEIQIGIEVKC